MKRIFRNLQSVDDILLLQGVQCGGYCQVVLRDRPVILGGSIASLAIELDDRFIRISRTVIVNKNHIVSFDKKSVSLSNGQFFDIARRRKKEVMGFLNPAS